MATANVRQRKFAGRCDNGSETGATWKYADGTCGDSYSNAENRNWTQLADQVFRVRFQISEIGGANKSDGYQLMYSTGGAYAAVGAATPMQYAESAEAGWTIGNGDSTTEQMAGTQNFVPGEYCEDAVTVSLTIKEQDTEIEFCLMIDSAQVNDEDEITLQCYYDDGVTPLTAYEVTPTITVSKLAAPKTISESSNLGVSDNVEVETTHAREESDAAGISDDVKIVTISARSKSDTIGLSDDVTVQIYAEPLEIACSDTVGLSDNIDKSVEHARSKSDTVGFSDSPNVSTEHARSGQDTIGLSDQVSIGVVHNRSLSDNLGLSDDASAAVQGSGIHNIHEGDTLGLSDDHDEATVHARQESDTIGFFDDVTALPEGVSVIEESSTIGISDQCVVNTIHNRVPSDTAGFSDIVHVSVARAIECSDTLGMSDDAQVTLQGGIVKTIHVSDPLGLGDKKSLATIHIRNFTSTIGLTDVVSTSGFLALVTARYMIVGMDVKQFNVVGSQSSPFSLV